MNLWSRWRRGGSGAPGSPASSGKSASRDQTLAHFRRFHETRTGVEAYIEPATRFDQTTVVLIARTGEWTRRRVPDPAAARSLARDLGVPVYDVQLTGYPARMRQWNAAQRSGRRPSEASRRAADPPS
jgi:hypothetical protein